MFSLTCCALPLLVVPVAVATPWLVPDGSAEHFTYSNGRDLNGYFGQPIVVGDSFVFPDFEFVASAADGASAGRTDTVSVDIAPIPGWNFAPLRITNFGRYEITGPSQQSLVDVEAALTLQETVPPGRQWLGPMGTSPGFPQHSGAGSWSGLMAVDITFEFPAPANAFHLEYSNGVIAVSGPGDSAYIELENQGGDGGFELHLDMMPIPEPASFALLTAGLGLLILRRNHRQSLTFSTGLSTSAKAIETMRNQSSHQSEPAYQDSRAG